MISLIKCSFVESNLRNASNSALNSGALPGGRQTGRPSYSVTICFCYSPSKMGYVDGKTDATLLIEEDDIEQDYEYLVVLQVCVKADLFVQTEYDHTLLKNNDCYVIVNNHKQ